MTIQPQRESEADQLGFANVAVTVSPITFYRPGLHDVHLELTSETRTIKLEVRHAPDDDEHAGQFVEVNPD